MYFLYFFRKSLMPIVNGDRDINKCCSVKKSATESAGHVEGMLNRDLRTTKTFCSSARIQNQCDCDPVSTECRLAVGISHVFPRKSKRFQQRRNSYAWNSLQRFKHILIVCIYLISIFNLPRSLSKPVSMDTEWWINQFEKGSSNSSSKCNILMGLCTSAKNIKYYATTYQTKHKQNPVTVNLHDFFTTFSKSSDEVDASEFANMNINEFIVTIYESLQKFAVGLDLVLKYEENSSKPLAKDTTHMNFLLRNFLIEISEYINAFDITPNPDVHRGDYTNNLDDSGYEVFSNVLFREYVNSLNYIYKGLSHFNQTECN